MLQSNSPEDSEAVDVTLPPPRLFQPVSPTGAVASWSGGKDCCLALSRVMDRGDLLVERLLTSVGEETGRVGHHGVPISLIEQQAESIGLALDTVSLPAACPNEVYQERMAEAVNRLVREGITTTVFGDIALEDVRAYRESRLEGTGMTADFPIWGQDPTAVAEEITSAYRVTVVAVDLSVLDRDHVGRPYDRAFVEDLPDGVDPAGENGEFHTFVHDGPIFANPVEVTVGRTVERSFEGNRYAYSDLTPSDPTPQEG